VNILLLTQYYWPEPFTINSLSELLVEQGQVVDVLTGKPNYPEGIVYDGYSISGLQIENKGSIKIISVLFYLHAFLLPLFCVKDITM